MREAKQKNKIAHLGIKSNKKGKTNIEIYGEEKAFKIKEKVINDHRNDWRKGKTYEEMYGEEKATEMKLKLSLRIGEKSPNYGKISKRKGKTNKEIFGEEKALKISNKISESGKGRIPYSKGKTYEEIFGKEKSIELKKKNRDIQKNASTKSGKTYEEFYGYNNAIDIKSKQRLSAIKRIIRNLEKGGQMQPGYNPNGCEYFNMLMKKTNTIIQHAENGGEYYIEKIGRWIDGYDKENNIAYEFDEKRHFNADGSLKEKDIQREQEIKSVLKCKIIRIKAF